MKTTSLFNFAKLFALSLLVIFSACTESEDPQPDPNTQNPNVPDLGGLGGGGTSDPGNQNPGGGQNTTAIGEIESDVANYSFVGFEYQAASAANNSGAYPIEYYHFDQDAVNDQDGDENVEGVFSYVLYNAASAGSISPGQYTYDPTSSSAGIFELILIADRGKFYALLQAQVQVATTNSTEVYGLVFEGQAVELRQVNGEFQAASDPFAMKGSLLIPPSVSPNARMEFSTKRALPEINVNISDLSF